MFVKICGIKKEDQIDKAIQLGYDAIGLVLYPKSKRFVDYDRAKELSKYCKRRLPVVAVSLTYDDIKGVEPHFDYIQIYEKKLLPNLIFASSEKPPESLNYKYFLYDASKGSGNFEEFPSWLAEYRKNLIVAGGLNITNIRKVIETIKPFGIDVSSGVEKNGEKDFYLMEQFIKEVKNESK